MGSSTHLVLAASLGLSRRIIGGELVRDLDIQITLVLLVGLVLQHTSDLLSLLYRQHFSEIEDGLFPMSIFGVRTGRETDRLVASGEINVKPCNQGVDEIITTAIERKGGGESEIGSGAGIEIKS